MPRSTVYVRLQWPAEGGAEEAGPPTSPQHKDSVQPSTLRKTQPQMSSTSKVPQCKEEKGGGAGDVRPGNKEPTERKDQKMNLKCSVCPVKSQDSLQSCPPVKSSTSSPLALVETSSTSVSTTTATTTISTTTSASSTTTTTSTSTAKHTEAASGTHAKAKIKIKESPREKLKRNLTERSHRTHQVKERTPGADHAHRGPLLDTSYSLDSPLWHSREQRHADGESEPQESDGKAEGVRTYYKSKARLRPKNPNAKGRRITRSLSASAVSVSTNTDPKDFLELAKITGTLPSRKKVKDPLTSKGNTPPDSDHVLASSRTEDADGGNTKPDSPGLTETKITPEMTHKKMEETEHEDGGLCKPKGSTGETKVIAEIIVEEDITDKLSDTRCAGDGCDDAEKGYIELPTYIPNPQDTQGKRHDHLPSYAIPPTIPPYPMTPCGPPYSSFHAHTGPLPLHSPYFTMAPAKGNASTEESKFIVITPHHPHPPPPDLKVETVMPLSSVPPTSPHLRLSPIPPSASPSYDHSQAFSTFRPPSTRTFHIGPQEDAYLTAVPHSVSPSSTHPYTPGELVSSEAAYQEAVHPKAPTHPNTEAPMSERCRGRGDKSAPAYPTNRPPTPAVPRRHLEHDMSLDSCPDVVLQTLEGEGSSGQNKTLKKSVTFLLPPDHWDSLISLRESCIGGYPQSGYAELDASLLPPNGDDPYRNTPSPGMQGLPQDRYDGGLDGEAGGQYPEDPRYPVPDGGLVYPPDGGVYGRLLGAPQSPYSVNGGVRASAEPLLPSDMYEEDQPPPPHPQHPPAPPPHLSPPTPSLPPVQNHDNYAHPSRLRPPSTDSTAPRVRWRDPDLHEVIDFLSNPNNVVKANAAAYLQHLCYMDDPTKQKTRILGGIPPLVALLTHDLPELHRNACGALRNLSYGRQNDENKRAIKDAQGIPALVRLLRKTPDNEIKELVTGILWNLSSCEDLKHSIIDDALTVMVSHVIIPCSGWDGGEVERDPNVDVWWSTVFKNASGVLRNISSAGEYARTKLRQCHGLVDSLLTVIKSAIQGSSHDNKSVENCVCILRNLSYRCQEVEDPNYDKNQPPTQSRATATAKGDNLGCFGGSRKKKEAMGGAVKESSGGTRATGPRTEPLRGMELLWQPEVVVGPYLALLSDCSNPETLEAAAGALQNLAACYWQPSIDVRAAVRKEKGLPILVELLRMEVDRVVCAVATALRNLAIDQRNKELIGKYAMRDLVQKLPSGNTHDSGTSDETIAAVLATLNEVIKKSAEFSRSLLDVGGVERLVNMTRHRGRYSVRVVKFASQVLFSMWGHQELREVYKKTGWKEQDFVSKSVAARNAASGGANSPTANNTLNRPMASQGGTRYEDRTIQRGQGKSHQMYAQGQEVPMADMGYGSGGGIGAPAGGVRLYPPVQGKAGEPVYAKVNRDKKRNRQYEGVGPQYGTLGGGAEDWSGPVYGGSPAASPSFSHGPPNNNNNNTNNNNNHSNNNGVLMDKGDAQAGDSWV
ncbi:catenin delta-2-like isoform X3 [Eriocheir sinensis]|uniref:catenin delta-2-like isoform X3 n=1 Tax=Eriocheir sinensis TaxID=95602 RepID=UPI0021C6896D|nr:catenin delta-2-like isoform X3 [Eriocheir sinensis]